MAWTTRRLSRRVLRGVGVVGAGLAATAVALATIPDSSGVIHGCYTKGSGALRVIDDSVTSCKPSETSLDWNAAGQPGPPGISGLEVVSADSAFTSEIQSLATAVCPTGKTAIGGGGVARSEHIDTPFALIASRPDPTVPEAWTALGREMVATDDVHAATAWVYCAFAS
jgi:hypothetical protein